MIDNSIPIEIAKILRKIDSPKCLAKAKFLENQSPSISTLQLRDLALNASDIISIANCFKRANNNQLIKSISFSYNPLLGDTGTIALLENLPKSICEIGLVNCGISDVGGIEILHWISNLPNLQMICMEQNNFSEKLRFEFEKFNTANPKTLVIY